MLNQTKWMVLWTSLLAPAALVWPSQDRTDIADAELPIISVTASSPHIANGEDPTQVSVMITDPSGEPFEEELDLFVALVAGMDDLEEIPMEHRGGGLYTGRRGTRIGGDAYILAFDRITEVTADADVTFLPGPPEFVMLTIGEPELSAPGTVSVELEASVRDAFANLQLADQAELEWSSSFGVLGSVSVSEQGVSTVSLVTNEPGVAQVTATDVATGLDQTFEVEFPAIKLGGPATVHIIDGDETPRLFDVPIEIFGGTECLDAYSMVLQFNDLTGFDGVVSGSSDGRFAAPNVRFLGSNLIEVSQVANTVGFESSSDTPISDVATLEFECLGEGDSTVSVILPHLLSKTGEELPTWPIEYCVCPNKRVKELCINPIIVKENNFTPSAGSMQSVADQLAALQKCFDEGCCKIKLKVKTKTGAKKDALDDDKKPADTQFKGTDIAIMDVGTDGITDGLVAWEASKVEPDVMISDDLIKIIDKSAQQGKRDNECINLYIVRNLKWKRGAGGRPTLLAGADVKANRINKAGTACETQKIKNFKGVTLNAADYEAAFVTAGNFELPDSTTIKHEIGHMLGLQHPWDYEPAVKDSIIGKDQKSAKSVMLFNGPHAGAPGRTSRSGFTVKECEIISGKNCSSKLDCPPE